MLPYRRLSAYYFFYFAFVGAFSPYFTLYLQDLSFSATDIAILMSLMQVMRVLAPNLWSWLAEHTGLRLPIVRLSALMSVAGFAIFFFTESFTGIFVGMALMAFFWSASLPLVETLTFAHLGREGHRYGSIRVWGSVGFIVAVLALGYVLDHVPIRGVLWAIVMILVGILVCAVLMPDARVAAPGRAVISLGATLRNPAVQALLWACFLMSAAHGVLYVFYSILLADQGYGKAVIGWLWSLGVIAEIVVFMFMPRLMQHFSLRQLLLFAFACAVLRFAAIGWGAGNLVVLLLAQVLHGATFGMYHAAAIAAINHWFPGKLQSRGQALYGSISFGAGGMLGGLISGYCWDWVGAAWSFTLGSVFALIGLLCLLFGWRVEADLRPDRH